LPAEKEQPENRIFREKQEREREREMKRRRFCGLCFSLSDCFSNKEIFCLGFIEFFISTQKNNSFEKHTHQKRKNAAIKSDYCF